MNSFFPNVMNKLNKLDIKITHITVLSFLVFSFLVLSSLSFIRPLHCDAFGIHNPIGLQLLRRLRMALSHQNEYKFKHYFRVFLNPLCAFILEPETTSRYLLRCHFFQTERRTLLNDIKEIDENISDHKSDLNQIYMGIVYGNLCGNGRNRYGTNRMVLLLTIKYCIDGKRFDLPFNLYLMEGKNYLSHEKF